MHTCNSFLLVRFLGNRGDICISQGVLWMFELRRWGLAALCCSLVLKSWWERGFIRQPEEVDKCSIPSSELNQIRVFSIKTAFPTCLSCSSERYELSPQTLPPSPPCQWKAVKIPVRAAGKPGVVLEMQHVQSGLGEEEQAGATVPTLQHHVAKGKPDCCPSASVSPSAE